ncbi:MAG: hypothetical protein ACSHX9_03300 [Luteolibacter sp.]
MKWIGYCLMLLIGVLIGRGLTGISNSRFIGDEAEPGITQSPRMRSADSDQGGIDALVRSELNLSDEDFSFRKTALRLYEKPQSPQRVRALLAYGIESREGELLLEDLKNGEIGSLELNEAVERLTSEFPDEVWGLLSVSGVRVSSWEGLMKVYTTGLQGLAKQDAPGVIDRLHEMEARRHRIFVANNFGKAWAAQDPATAVKYFTEMTEFNISGKQFANRIVNSWNSRNPDEMKEYVEELPAGSTKQFLETAIKQLPKE